MFVVMLITLMAVIALMAIIASRLARPITFHPKLAMAVPYPIARHPHIMIIRHRDDDARTVIEIISGLGRDGYKSRYD